MLAKIWKFNAWITETSPKKLSDKMTNILQDAGFTILGENVHYFQPQGYTKVYLLCESHFAIHTFPEHERTYIELSSCNEKMYNKAVKSISKEFDIISEEMQ